jgi:hypothetical protein
VAASTLDHACPSNEYGGSHVHIRASPVPQEVRAIRLFAGFALPTLAATDAHLIDSYGKLPLQFEANRGQTDEVVRFLSRGSVYSLYLTAIEAVLVLATPNPEAKPNQDAKRDAQSLQARYGTLSQTQLLALRMRLVGAASRTARKRARGIPRQGKLLHWQESRTVAHQLAHYAKVHYQNVNPGIDLLCYGNLRQLEYDFIVAPGADLDSTSRSNEKILAPKIESVREASTDRPLLTGRENKRRAGLRIPVHAGT